MSILVQSDSFKKKCPGGPIVDVPEGAACGQPSMLPSSQKTNAISVFARIARVLSSPYLLLLLAGGLLLRDEVLLRKVYAHSTFYFILCLVIAWGVSFLVFLRSRGFSLAVFLRKNIVAFVSIFLICGFVVALVPAVFRVLSDETNLVSVSYQMAKDTQSLQPLDSMMFRGECFFSGSMVPGKHNLFPFLVQIIHRILGYRAENAFILNSIVLFFLLFLTYLYVAGKDGFFTGMGAVLLVAAHPIIVLTAASGGYDLLHTLLLFLSFLALREFLKSRSRSSFAFLGFSLVLLSHTRHEDFLFFFLTMGALVVAKQIPGDFFRGPLFFLFLLFLWPIFWQKALTEKLFLSQLPDGVPFFSVASFLKANAVFLKNIFRLDFVLPYASVLFLFALLAAVVFFVKWLRQRWKKGSLGLGSLSLVSCITLINFASLWIVQTSNFRANCNDPGSARFYIPICLVVSLVSALFLSKLFRRNSLSVFLLGLLCFLTYFPMAMNDAFFWQIAPWKEYQRVCPIFQSFPDKNFVVISSKSKNYSVFGYGSIPFEYANQNKKRLIRGLRRKNIGRIFVIQNVSPKNNRLVKKGQRLDKAFQLKKIVDVPVSSDHCARISQVILKKDEMKKKSQ